MSKELTEQLLNGTLKEGDYWCELTESPYVERVHLPCCDDIVVEVLAPIPDYTEWKQTEEQVQNLQRMVEQECSRRCELEKQLKEAEEALKYYANSFYGDEQPDGTYLIYVRENAKGRVEVTYNPNIAKQYLERYGKR